MYLFAPKHNVAASLSRVFLLPSVPTSWCCNLYNLKYLQTSLSRYSWTHAGPFSRVVVLPASQQYLERRSPSCLRALVLGSGHVNLMGNKRQYSQPWPVNLCKDLGAPRELLCFICHQKQAGMWLRHPQQDNAGGEVGGEEIMLFQRGNPQPETVASVAADVESAHM